MSTGVYTGVYKCLIESTSVYKGEVKAVFRITDYTASQKTAERI